MALTQRSALSRVVLGVGIVAVLLLVLSGIAVEAILARDAPHELALWVVGVTLAVIAALWLWVVGDIGAARAAHRELARNQHLLHAILDAIPNPILVKDRDYRLITVNRAYAERSGHTVEEVIGKTTHELMPWDEAEDLVEADREAFKTGKDQVFELPVTNRAKNMVRMHLVTKRLAYDIDGQPMTVGLHTDVTELRRSIAEFSAVIQDTPLVAVFGIDRYGIVTQWNRASESLFGYAAVRARGSRLQDLLLNGRMLGRFEGLLENIWEHKAVYGPREIRLVLPGRQPMWLLATLFPIVQEDVVVEVFGMALDISSRRRAQRQLALHRDNLQRMVDERTAGLMHATEELRTALHARSEFLANMSHELRTPMHAILSFAQLGMDRVERGPADKLRDYFQRINASGERLLLLINDLLDLSKLESGKMPITPRKCDMLEMVRNVARELEPLIEKKRLHLALPEDKAYEVDVDPQRMAQVLHNLFSNAIKFSPEGGEIRIMLDVTRMPRGRRVTDQGEQSALWLIVEDDGPGIPVGELDDIFDKFIQSSKTRSGAGGTGLGLSICREIVNAHHGRITARNTPHGGAAFDVFLPLPQRAAQTPPREGG